MVYVKRQKGIHNLTPTHIFVYMLHRGITQYVLINGYYV